MVGKDKIVKRIMSTRRIFPPRSGCNLVRFELTQRNVAELQKYRDKIPLSYPILWQTMKRRPATLSREMMVNIIRGTVGTVAVEHYAHILTHLKTFRIENIDKSEGIMGCRGGASIHGRIVLTDEKIDLLKQHRDRTKVGPGKLAQIIDGKKENDLFRARIYHWLSGRVRTADSALYDKVLTAWEGLPDAPPGARLRLYPNMNKSKPRSIVISDQGEVQLTRHHRIELFRAQEQSGLNPRAFLDEGDDVPDGLTSFTIHSWMSRKAETADAVHLRYVLERWPKKKLVKKDSTF